MTSDEPAELKPDGSSAVTESQEVGRDSSTQALRPRTPTRASGLWAAVVAGLLVLLALIIFILENGQRAKVSFFGAHGELPQGVALALAAVIGGLFVALAGAVRILELRGRARRQRGQIAAGGVVAGEPEAGVSPTSARRRRLRSRHGAPSD